MNTARILTTLPLFAPLLHGGLLIDDLGKQYTRDPERTPPALYATVSSLSGSTSIRNVDTPNMVWKEKGYYQRNRDLGQVFNVPPERDVAIDAIVLRTGNSRLAIKAGAPRARLFVQFFEVTGEPRINDNGTLSGDSALHGFTENHRADDYIEGVAYRSIRVVEGGSLPPLSPTTENGGQPGHLRYLRFDLTEEDELTLEAGKRYAFLVGFLEAGAERNMTFGNDNLASDPRDSELRLDANGMAIWSIRREGDGSAPARTTSDINPATNERFAPAELTPQSQFPPNRFAIEPTSDGYPDVDTYRALEYYIELK